MAIKNLSSVYLTFFIFLSIIGLANSGCLKLKQLTNDTNKHDQDIKDVKLSSDSKRVYSMDLYNIKIWDLIGSSLVLKQGWTDPNFDNPDIYFRKLFVWNNGKKLFATRNQDIYIFKFNQEEGKYDINNYEWIKISQVPMTEIQSISVNQEGNQIYVSQKYDRKRVLLRYTFDGEKWLETTPNIFTQEIKGYGLVKNLMLTKNQKRLIVYAIGNEENQQDIIKIFDLSSSYPVLVQKIIVKNKAYHQDFLSSCQLSSQDKYISCVGWYFSHTLYVLDQKSNLYVNVSANDPSPQYPSMNHVTIDEKKNTLTQMNAGYGKVLYVYDFDISNRDSPKFTLKESLKITDLACQDLKVLVADLQSRFYLIGINDRIFMASCYQLREQNLIQEIE